MRARRAIGACSLTVALAGSGLVAAAGTSQAATAQTAAKGCYVTASSAKVRSKASTGSTTVGVAYKGNRCQEKDVVIKGSHFWYKVRMITGNAKGETGWIRDDLLHTSADDTGTCIPEDPSCHS
ncbi:MULTISPECIES: SH3 domain-containing protein [Streptomyces]|uniref:SH3 domain-containing protein n=1 Tax=Streptomyces scabiei TaxID=1930 RepID=UPI001B3363FE|nr:SH3 domain-containing protein [Streptomyces sp. LBUM 1487]